MIAACVPRPAIDVAVDRVVAGVADAVGKPAAVDAGVGIEHGLGLLDPVDGVRRLAPESGRVALPARVDLGIAAGCGVHRCSFARRLSAGRWMFCKRGRRDHALCPLAGSRAQTLAPGCVHALLCASLFLHASAGTTVDLLADPMFMAVAVIGVCLLGISKGGFLGLGVMALPLMSLFVPPLQAAAIILPTAIAQDFLTLWVYRRRVERLERQDHAAQHVRRHVRRVADGRFAVGRRTSGSPSA